MLFIHCNYLMSCSISLFSVPGPPQSVRILGATITQLKVGWDPPGDLNGTLKGYYVFVGKSEKMKSKGKMNLVFFLPFLTEQNVLIMMLLRYRLSVPHSHQFIKHTTKCDEIWQESSTKVVLRTRFHAEHLLPWELDSKEQQQQQQQYLKKKISEIARTIALILDMLHFLDLIWVTLCNYRVQIKMKNRSFSSIIVVYCCVSYYWGCCNAKVLLYISILSPPNELHSNLVCTKEFCFCFQMTKRFSIQQRPVLYWLAWLQTQHMRLRWVLNRLKLNTLISVHN